MRGANVILSILVACLFLTPAVSAQSFLDWDMPWVGEIPDLEVKDWSVGQYVTYKATVNYEEENLEGSVRLALVGQDIVEGEDFYWFELDLFDISDLPEDFSGIDAGAFKIKLLIKEYDLKATEVDPEQLIQDIFSMKFINRVIFQLNDDEPMEIDSSILEMFSQMMDPEMLMQDMSSEKPDEIMDMIDDLDWGVDYTNVNTPAGSFSDAMNIWVAGGDETGEAKLNIYCAEDLPISGLVKLDGSFTDSYSEESVDFVLELIEYGNDAESWVEGTPVLFSFENMMGGMGGFGGM